MATHRSSAETLRELTLPRAVLRSARVVVAVGVVAILAVGCGGANERRSNTNAAGAPSVPGNVTDNPVTTPAPAKNSDPLCAPLANFQLFNYSAGSFDPNAKGADKDSLIKGLEDAANKVSAAIPELSPAIKVVVAQDKAKLNGQGTYTPAAGEPSVEDAGKKLFEWAKSKDC